MASLDEALLDLVEDHEVYHCEPPANQANDMVKQPKHYEVLPGVEAKHIIEATLIKLYGPEAYKAYCHGNMIKYSLRKKYSVEEDVAKAGRYSEMHRGEDK